jgi:hypothetical protein
MDYKPGFARLLESAGLIVRHADYPGKGQVVERCQQEVEELTRSGRITSTEGETLREILLCHNHQTA